MSIYFKFQYILFCSFFIIRSTSIKCFGGSGPADDEETFVDHTCPTLSLCYAYYYSTQGTDFVYHNFTNKGCLETSMAAEFQDSPPCAAVAFEHLNLSEQQLKNGFKCVCNRDFCNGFFETSQTTRVFSFSSLIIIALVYFII